MGVIYELLRLPEKDRKKMLRKMIKQETVKNLQLKSGPFQKISK